MPSQQELEEKAQQLLQQGKSEVEEAEKEPEEEQEEESEEEEHPEDEQKAVSSSMLSEWGYDRENEVIEVVFANGHEESYGCTPDQWEQAQNAPSAGKWMWENVL